VTDVTFITQKQKRFTALEFSGIATEPFDNDQLKERQSIEKQMTASGVF
jgi:hypothetical protein